MSGRAPSLRTTMASSVRMSIGSVAVSNRRAGRKRSQSSCRPACGSKTRPTAPPFPGCSTAVAKDYFKRTGFFPIMHVVGIRRELAERHPWLPGAVYKAFEQAKAAGLKKLSDTSATKVTLPFVEERLSEARALMGDDFWSYGVEANRKVLDYFLAQHHGEGLSSRRVQVDELFHPAT